VTSYLIIADDWSSLVERDQWVWSQCKYSTHAWRRDGKTGE